MKYILYMFFNYPRLTHVILFVFPKILNPTRLKYKINQPRSCSTQQRESGKLSCFNLNHNLLTNRQFKCSP